MAGQAEDKQLDPGKQQLGRRGAGAAGWLEERLETLGRRPQRPSMALEEAGLARRPALEADEPRVVEAPLRQVGRSHRLAAHGREDRLARAAGVEAKGRATP